MLKLNNCNDCGAKPGKVHKLNCDVEMCSVCGGQRLQCEMFEKKGCEAHDKQFARWTGFWPGEAEAAFLEIDLNEFQKYRKQFFVKPL